ncbi:hypothetical protein COT72_03400 [archaeon CG10_big_fil_rev_8_21_14_0_10_43_11]|nr:MAG: hypothetical protein COT72_03400 [archaeon CG10_big_fil_rev_8_21_14_0_10_43_11]
MATDSLLINVFSQLSGIADIFAPEGVNGVVFVLAFLLVFVIIYNALLMTGRLFGQQKHGAMRLIISFVIAYTATLSPTVVLTIERAFPPLSIFLIGMVALMFTLYFIFPENVASGFLSSNLMRLAVAGAILLIFWAATTGGALTLIEPNERGLSLGGFLISDYDIALLLLIGGFILLIAWAFKGEGQSMVPSLDAEKILKWLLKRGV